MNSFMQPLSNYISQVGLTYAKESKSSYRAPQRATGGKMDKVKNPPYRWWAFELSLWGLAFFMLVLRVLSWFNGNATKKSI